jgi:hypothetical protein
LKMANGTLQHTINQALFLTQKEVPIDQVSIGQPAPQTL